MALLTGDLAKTIGRAVGAALAYPVTLHRRDAGTNGYGEPVTTLVDHALTGLRLDARDLRRFSEAVPDATVAAIVLQYEAPAAPRVGDELTVKGSRYHVLASLADPADATWTLALRPA